MIPTNRKTRRGTASVEYATVLGVVVLLATSAYLLGRGLFGSLDESVPAPDAAEKVEGEENPQPEQEVFVDDFSGRGRPDNKKWEWMGNSWQEKQGRLWTGYPQTKKEHRLLASGSGIRDGKVEVQAALESGQGMGLFFRAAGSVEKVNGYSFDYDPEYEGGSFVFRKWVAGYQIWPPLAATRAAGAPSWDGSFQPVAVDMRGDSFTASVGGRVVLTGSDTAYTSGQAGMRTWGGSRIGFDDFTITGRRE